MLTRRLFLAMAAAALSGGTLEVDEDRLVVPGDADTYLVSDLVGCDLWIGAARLGSVSEVHAAPANDVLEVDAADGPVLVPFTADAVVAVDLDARRIDVRPDLFA